jgi:two-component system, NtrC family, response regulator HydG
MECQHYEQVERVGQMQNQDLNQYWKIVVDTIQDGVMIVNPDGIIVSVNRGFEKITGYPREEVQGRSCTLLNCTSCELARNQEGCHFCVMFKRGILRQQRCVVKRKDGDAIHILKNASVLKDGEGAVIGAVETMTDITNLVNKEIQIESYRKELHDEDRFQGMIGVSASIQRVFGLIENAAHSDAPVIIYGESGTGKELVAQAIHDLGLRKKMAYVKVNCAALNESLLESELFGHVKGAFTGAHRSREGRFGAASGGDIFLDEIGELPLSTQIKLLRVLEEKVVERVGDNLPIGVDVRIISATNRNLAELIAKGDFREDFFYRINVIPITVPPLRERVEDIPLLSRSFFNKIQLKSGKKLAGISNAAMERLIEYRWPGNIRELKSAFEFAFVSCREGMIEPEHLPQNIIMEVDRPGLRPALPADIDMIKKQRLIKALEACKGNQSKAARHLGISRTSVWNQMKRFGLKT